MHILVTADTLGGVWTYARELVTGLVKRGTRVTLVSFGNIPTLDQVRWMNGLSGLDFRPTGFRLEWMQESEDDLRASAEYLRMVVQEVQPDLLHFNQYYYGALDCDLPRIVVAHSDVIGWWKAVHKTGPRQDNWHKWYRRVVSHGLAAANIVVAPSQWMLDSIGENYFHPEHSSVIYNGRTPALFNPYVHKENYSISVGRLWDLGKNAALLTLINPSNLVCLAGEDTSPEAGSTHVPSRGEKLLFKGTLSEQKLRHLLAHAAIYIATSQYEPFGLAPVEAALCRCAVLASDIPSFRQLWDDAAVYFESNNPSSLEQALKRLTDDQELSAKYGQLAYARAIERFSAERMVNEYLALYATLVRTEAIAA